MGGQLWTPPITGYRRKGTRLSEIRAAIGTGITASSILEPLRCSTLDSDAEEVAEILTQRDWDIAGVVAMPDTPVIGFVERSSLHSGAVSAYMKKITADHLISESATLSGILSVLRNRSWTLVLRESAVNGIITHADLNKPPVRVYLFGLVSLLEMHLAFWIHTAYPNDTWKESLNDKRVSKAMKLYKERKDRNDEITVLQCLQFCDKRDLILFREDLRQELGIESKTNGKRMLESAESLRNDLSHSQADLASESSWPDVISLVEWIETTVDQSDDAAETKAETSRDEDLMLWAAG